MEIIHTGEKRILIKLINSSTKDSNFDDILVEIEFAFMQRWISEEDYLELLKGFCSQCSRLKLKAKDNGSYAKALISVSVLEDESKAGFIPSFQMIYDYIEQNFFPLVMVLLLAGMTLAFIGGSFPETYMKRIGLLFIAIAVISIIGGVILTLTTFKKENKT